jgi:hypothetical protein
MLRSSATKLIYTSVLAELPESCSFGLLAHASGTTP